MADKDPQQKKSDDDLDATTPRIDSDTFSQVSEEDAANVKGGLRASGTTLNPTSTDGCCGG